MMSRSRVLVVEDDRTLAEVLRYNLDREGYEVIIAGDGEEALELARAQRPDLVILDIMLPKLDGLQVCRILRNETNVPIMMLTAKTEEVEKILGLEIGADDYITKPFSMRELLARAKSMLRRVEAVRREATPSALQPGSIVSAGELEIDLARHQATLRGTALNLTPREFALLAFLTSNVGRAFTRDQLLDLVWGHEYVGDTRTVDVHVRWLRQKLEADPAQPRHILTVRGVGYKFEA